ncbi:MAG: RagB/SusD family nutrient uptake outer membrane protein [Bacteroidales bacterium]|nr:RagB/SusD family nutrient uptake outer membrane protein [Bacteroidales bacterium]
MKNTIVKFLFVLTAGAALSSCMKDTQPTGVITQERLSEVIQAHPEKFEATINGIYSDIQTWSNPGISHNYFGQKGFDYLTSLQGNDMIMTGRFAMSLYHYLLDYWQADYNATLTRWREYYNNIANANGVLKVATADVTDPAMRQYRAIALGIRGYSYLQLSYLYQYSYYVGADDTVWGKGAKYDHSQDKLVPLVDENTTEDQPRSTVSAVFDFLIKDLEEAYAIFDAIDAVRTASPTDVDGCVVATYLARAYMIKHDWANAQKYAKVVMDNFGILTSEDDILQGFSDINLPDVVWGCDITSDNTGIYRSWFSLMDYFGDGYAGIGVWRAGFGPFVDRIDDDDIRREWFLDGRNPLTPKIAAVAYQSIKFIGAGRKQVFGSGFDGTGWELGDYIYLRSEEAYFMYAECLAHQGNLSEAITALEAIMSTRQPGYSCPAADKADFLEELNFQKRVEFWGEGMEFLDNRRLNIPIDRTDETWGAANNHLAAARFYHDQEDREFLYQIPVSEIENNKQINESDQN